MEDPNCGLFVPTPRPGSRTFSVVTAEHLVSRINRVDLRLEDVIREELDDFSNGRDASAEAGVDADAFALAEDDRAIWERGRLLAVIRPRAGGDPEVIRLDGPSPGSSLDRGPDA